MVIVSDTSTISNLFIIDKLEILQDLFLEVIIPIEVFNELVQLKKNFPTIEDKLKCSWIYVRESTNIELKKSLEIELDKGEIDAIALAIELKADLLLIDEKKGRRIAKEMGLTIIGLIGVLIRAKSQNLINSITDVIDELRTIANFRISDKLYSEILKIDEAR